MSECKHEFIFLGMGDMHRCKKCGLMADSFTAIIFQNERLEKAELKENELQAQVAVLRGALELYGDLMDYTSLAVDALQRGVMADADKYFGKKRMVCTAMKNALVTTPAEAAERVQRLVSTLELASNCLVDGSAIKNEAQKALSEWRRDKCSS